jgi:hypothetical protein
MFPQWLLRALPIPQRPRPTRELTSPRIIWKPDTNLHIRRAWLPHHKHAPRQSRSPSETRSRIPAAISKLTRNVMQCPPHHFNFQLLLHIHQHNQLLNLPFVHLRKPKSENINKNYENIEEYNMKNREADRPEKSTPPDTADFRVRRKSVSVDWASTCGRSWMCSVNVTSARDPTGIE